MNILFALLLALFAPADCSVSNAVSPGSTALVVVSNVPAALIDANAAAVTATGSDQIAIGDVPALATGYAVVPGSYELVIGETRYGVTVTEGERQFVIAECR